jgi:tRNA(fMet)-specific endonuclease VapC
MILLDTDHSTFLKYPESERGGRLIARMEAASTTEVFGVAIITVEERMRGWLAVIAREKSPSRQVVGYRELGLLFEFYREFEVIPFDDAAARRSEELGRLKLRLGTMDRKIAATALVNDALLLTANRADFQKVPGLRVENWLD